ncbi:MAG TPA: hypothetical protein VN182_04815 [Flavobacterium sp.]|nr:hypothetical protein [Flavobacterium sp.]
MTRNINYYEQIEDYCQQQLSPEIKLEFEAELASNPELREEVELWMDIQSALEEKEIISLRDKLKNVITHESSKNISENTFDLLSGFSDMDELTECLSAEDLISFYDSLPKVHAYHHESTSNENIHQFYKKQNGSKAIVIDDESDDFDLEEFEGLEEAILEKDVLQLRNTLSQIAKTIEPQFTVEEIDEYLSGELSGADLIDFEKDLIVNRSLQKEVKLHKEIESALQENDILDLRNQLANILKSETSWNVSENSIEDFVDGVLEGELLDEFNSELLDNNDLLAEVELRKQINEAISERDIMNLRAELGLAREAADTRKVKMLIPESKTNYLNYWKTSVAIIVLLLGVAGVLRNGIVSVDRTYDNFYEAPSWAPERAVSNEISFVQQVNTLYSNAAYLELIKKLDEKKEMVDGNPVLGFYKAASYQNLNRINEAVDAYSQVILDGDNLFIEEAEWYRSLCYVKIGDKLRAKNELLAVIERKGHYEKDAKAVLRRLKYNLK